jgi:hypothetical protein
MYHIYRCTYANPYLHGGMESHLIIGKQSFNILLTWFASIIKRFVHICSSEILASNFFSCSVLVWLWYQGNNTGFIKWAVLLFLEEFRRTEVSGTTQQWVCQVLDFSLMENFDSISLLSFDLLRFSISSWFSSYYLVGIFCCLFLKVLGFELRISHVLGRYSITWVMPPDSMSFDWRI